MSSNAPVSPAALTLSALGASSIAEVAQRLSHACPATPVKQHADGSYFVGCPAHGDGATPNLHVSQGTANRDAVTFFCFSCGHERQAAVLAAVRATLGADRLGAPTPTTRETNVTPLRVGQGGVVGTPADDEPVRVPSEVALAAKVAELTASGWRCWPLYGLDGPVALHARRDAVAGEPKRFCWWTYRQTALGLRWVPKGLPAGHRYPLYFARRSPRPNVALPLLLVEGQKTADAAAALWPQHDVAAFLGASMQHDLSTLQGRHVVIVPDADEPGVAAAARLGNEISLHVEGKVSVVTLPPWLLKEHPGWDVADAWPSSFTPDELLALAVPLSVTKWSVIARIRNRDDLAKYFFMLLEDGGHKNVTFIDGPTGREFSAEQLNAAFVSICPVGTDGPATYLKRLARWDDHKLSGYTVRPDLPNERIIKEPGPNGSEVLLYNKFFPFSVAKVAGNVDRWLNFGRELLPATELEILVRMIASIAQRPAERHNWMYLMQGSQSVGKNTLLKVLKNLVGSHNFVEVHYPSVAKSGENGVYATKLVVVLNELSDLGNPHVQEYLKEIADEDLTVRQKYVAAYSVPNIINPFGTTNQDIPIHNLASDDRRFYVAKVLPTAPLSLARGARFFVEFYAWLNEQATIEALAHYFHTYKLPDDYNPKQIPEDTEAKTAMHRAIHRVENLFREAFVRKTWPLDRDLFSPEDLKHGLLSAFDASSPNELQNLFRKLEGDRRIAKNNHGSATGVWMLRDVARYRTFTNTGIWKEYEQQKRASTARERGMEAEEAERRLDDERGGDPANVD